MNNNILYIIGDNGNYGGCEKMLLWVGKMLASKGHNVKFLFLYHNFDVDTNDIPFEYLELPYYNSYLMRNVTFFTKGAWALFKYLKYNNVKYVLSFASNSFYLLGIYKYRLNYKMIVSERADPNVKRLGWLRKRFFSNCEYSVFQISGAKDFFTRNKEENNVIIPNPVIIPNEIWDDSKADDVIISVGRINLCQKRQDILLEAFKKVHKVDKKVKLLFVGGGYEENILRQMIVSERLEDFVSVEGFKDNINCYLLKSKIFVLSSDFEGMPNSLLEAMAIGMPVVSTDCSPGGAAFLIDNGINGSLVPRRDANSLANSIIALLQDRNKRISYGKEARIRASKQTVDKIACQWSEVCDKLMQ